MDVAKHDKVEAFHPRRFGVVNIGTVIGVGPKYVRIDFGELLGGTFRVPRRHIVNVIERTPKGRR
jgi:hypothetical protein